MSFSIFQHPRWQGILDRIVDVLRINVCVVDAGGRAVSVPSINPYGWSLLLETSDVVSQFSMSEDHLEYVDALKLHYFAVPLNMERAGAQYYVLIGPVALNKKLTGQEYRELFTEHVRDVDELMSSLEGVRVVSNTNIRNLVDLVSELVKLEIDRQADARDQKNLLDVYQLLLGLALGISRAKSGSIMLFDVTANTLSIKAAQGLDERYVRLPVPLGGSIAGLALEEKKVMILADQERDPNNRVARLLKRKEIERSIVLPFEVPGKGVSGVLSLNIADRPNDEMELLAKNLSQIVLKTLEV